MRKKQVDPQVWLTNLVKTMMRQLRIVSCGKSEITEPTLSDIQRGFGGQIQGKLLKMSPAKRGEIADLHKGSVGGSAYWGSIDKSCSGRTFVTAIAAQVIVNRMYELLEEMAGLEQTVSQESGGGANGDTISHVRV